MTHKELMKTLNFSIRSDAQGVKLYKALREVVKLHKPVEWRDGCPACDCYKYPCPTIEAIEVNLCEVTK